MSLIKHNRTTVAKPTRNIFKNTKKHKKTKQDCRKKEEANIVHKHAPNTNNLTEVMVEIIGLLVVVKSILYEGTIALGTSMDSRKNL